MRLLAFALAILPIVWAQDPEGFPTGTATSSVSEVTPKTWASAATTTFPTLPTYTPPPVTWTTITSDGTEYKMQVTPTTSQAYTTVTSGGGIWKIPVTPSSAPAASGTPVTNSTHRTRTIVLSVIFSFVGAVLLLLAAMFIMRVRAQRRARSRRSWAMRPGGWVTEQKHDHTLDPEYNSAQASFPEPEVPAPPPSHTRQRSL